MVAIELRYDLLYNKSPNQVDSHMVNIQVYTSLTLVQIAPSA